ncbi:M24 family metallopeptidase [Elusimicrobiota bacterium]
MFVKEIRKYLADNKASAILIDNFAQLQYVLGIYKTIPYGEARGNLIVGRERMILITDPLSRRLIEGFLPDDVRVIIGDGHSFSRDGFLFLKEIKNVAQKERLQKIILLNQRIADFNWSTLKTKFVKENPVLHLADITTGHEKMLIEKAAGIVDRVYDIVAGEIKDGISEILLRNRIDELMYGLGAQSTTFPTIVAFGEHTNQIHAKSGMSKLKKHDLVMVDYGAVVDGVGSDLTRTFVLGKAGLEQKRMWNAVFAAQKACLGAIRPGKSGRAIDGISREVIKKHGFKDYYFHTLGHQLGLLTGKFLLSPGEKGKIKKGMLLTVEPGVYTPIGGVRIEDDIVVTDNGIRILTKASKIMEV